MDLCIDLCKRFLMWLLAILGEPRDHAHPTLLPGKTLVFQAEVAAEFGVNGAIILQKIHEWCEFNRKKQKPFHYVEGRWWAFNSYEEWQAKHFGWLSVSTVKREFGKLRKRGLLLTGSHGKRGDRRLWSAVEYDRLRAILTPGLAEGVEVKRPSVQIDPMPVQIELMGGSDWATTSIESQPESQKKKSKDVIPNPDGEEILNAGGVREASQKVDDDYAGDLPSNHPHPLAPPPLHWEEENKQSPEYAWKLAKIQLELQFDRATWERWLQEVEYVGYEQGAEAALFVLGTPNSYARDMLEHRLYRNVRRVLSDVFCCGQDVELRFEVVKAAPAKNLDEPMPLFRLLAQQGGR